MSYVSKFESLWPRVTRLDGGVWDPLMSGLRRLRAAGRYIIEVVLTVGPGSAAWRGRGCLRRFISATTNVLRLWEWM